VLVVDKLELVFLVRVEFVELFLAVGSLAQVVPWVVVFVGWVLVVDRIERVARAVVELAG
jgi:hypothetical protein